MKTAPASKISKGIWNACPPGASVCAPASKLRNGYVERLKPADRRLWNAATPAALRPIPVAARPVEIKLAASKDAHE
jgi:hypothetical protein